jgi:hypothetical protein
MLVRSDAEQLAAIVDHVDRASCVWMSTAVVRCPTSLAFTS